MKNLVTICAVVMLMAGLVSAITTTWDVATIHGQNQFTISGDASSLLYHGQPRTTNGDYWYNNNGSAPGVLAIGGKQTPNGYRDGSRTFATTDVAVGQKLNNIKLAFDYKTALGYTTVNFFMTDGAGKFGIFAPTSLGIAGVSTSQVIDSVWTRITFDLTVAIPDDTNVAVYEHNGLAVDKIEPFTTMQWGDIKDLNIAGMYDYQRSPAKGWGYWGKMFDQINTAGNATVVNGQGLALIWGDTVGNDPYTTAQREIRNVTVSFGGTDYTGTFANDQYTNVLELNVQDDPVYMQPGEFVVIDMDAWALSQYVFGCQAVLNFSSTHFIATPTGPGSPIVAPGGGVWDELIYSMWNTGGDLDVAIGVDLSLGVGTKADGTVAKFTLTATNNEGTTKMIFRTDGDDVSSTFFGDANAQAVYPGSKINSQDIVIDGTDPTAVTISAAPVSWTTLNSVTLTFSATDAISGIDHYELSIDSGAYSTQTSPYVLDVSAFADGTHTATVKAIDKAGNEATASTTIDIDHTPPTDVVITADPTSWTTADAVTLTFSADGALSGIDHYELSIDSGAYSTQTSSYVLDVSAFADGTHTATVKAIDKAGNEATASTTIDIDHTPPTDVVITADPTSWTTADAVTLTFSADGALSGIDHYELSIDSGAYSTQTSSYVLDVSAFADGTHTATVKAIDKAGNEATDITSFYIDHTNPLIAIVSAKQGGPELIPSGTALQGVVNIKVTASDATSPLSGQPTVTVTPNDGSPEAATYVNEIPSGTFNYTWSVSSTIPNGTATINASVSDIAGNSENAGSQTFSVNKNQVTGQVQLQNFVGASRAVTFVATGGVANKTWTQTLSFTGGIASFTLTDVPSGTTNLSAKTNLNLRKKVAVGGGTDDQWTADLTGASKLLGGDLNNSNTVNILDYSILKRFWYTTNPIADIDGNGEVTMSDYLMLQGNFFKTGSPQ